MTPTAQLNRDIDGKQMDPADMGWCQKLLSDESYLTSLSGGATADATAATSARKDELIRDPTDTDVLLGRGVATNRHPGNVNFRNIVSEHVNVYVTSTKKQKMMISRSIVDKVRKELNPPGRFLEKESSGLWSEVDTKKALEKTAQALRDGAYPLRKQLSEDFSDSSFLAAVFDVKADGGDGIVNGQAGAGTGTSATGTGVNEKPAPHPLRSAPIQRGHRRRVSAPVIVQQIPADLLAELPDAKRSKPNSPNYCPEPIQQLNHQQNQLNNNVTGINFPSPGVSQDNVEFIIGSNNAVEDSRGYATKKQHRRNRTFGGYSCSDRTPGVGNVSDMNIDDIFALFVGPGSGTKNAMTQQQQQQLEQASSNGMPNGNSSDISQLFQASSSSSPTNLMNGVMFNQNQMVMNGINSMNGISQYGGQNNCEGAPLSLNEQLKQQNELQNNGMMAQLFSNSSPQNLHSSPPTNQADMMMYSPHTSPSPQIQGQQGSNDNADNFEIPHLLGLEQHDNGLPELNLMTNMDNNKTLSGAKRHRRYNTIASGHCFSGNQTANAVAAPSNDPSENLQQFNLNFLQNINNMTPGDEPLHTGKVNNTQPIGDTHQQFYEFNNLPIQKPTAPTTNNSGRHRRMKTTGNIGLPQDWNFSLDNQPSVLNTIDEEIPNYPLTHDCGSLMSSQAEETRDSSTNKPPTQHHKTPSMNLILDSFVPNSVGHTRDMSSKSSLSNDDFCSYLMADGENNFNWGGGDAENDGLMISGQDTEDGDGNDRDDAGLDDHSLVSN